MYDKTQWIKKDYCTVLYCTVQYCNVLYCTEDLNEK